MSHTWCVHTGSCRLAAPGWGCLALPLLCLCWSLRNITARQRAACAPHQMLTFVMCTAKREGLPLWAHWKIIQLNQPSWVKRLITTITYYYYYYSVLLSWVSSLQNAKAHLGMRRESVHRLKFIQKWILFLLEKSELCFYKPDIY